MPNDPRVPPPRPVRPSTDAEPPPEPALRRVSSEDLLRGERQLEITHQGELYRLQITRQGKLIMTK